MSDARPLSHLLADARLSPVARHGGDPQISGATLDSRAVQPGDVFFAIRGERADGTRFAQDALRRGACAVVAAAPPPGDWPREVAWVQVENDRVAAARLSRECYGRPDEDLELIGVTGTNGKTTVTWLVEAIARAAGRPAGRIGTTGAGGSSGDAATLQHTTPEAPVFYGLLRRMRDAGVEWVAVEVSSHALALSRVDGAHFRVAAFLNLSRDHLDFHGDERRYFETKASLFDLLGPDDHAVLPAGGPYTDELRRRTRARVLTFGSHPEADVRIVEADHSLDGSRVTLSIAGDTCSVRTTLAGTHNAENVAAAAACATALGVSPEAVAAGVAALDGVPGRMERVSDGRPAVVVDYAHTPDALEHLLSTVRALAAGRVHVVFGCGGGRDAGKRAPMGEVAARGADVVWITADNPRDEEPDRIADAVAKGVGRVAGAPERTHREPDRRTAIRRAIAAAADEDVVVIAGKGHEREQIVGGQRRPFDDVHEAREALARRRAGGTSCPG